MGKSATVLSEQLSLFDLIEEEQQDQDDLSTTGKFSEMPEYIVVERKWADSDTSPEQLERLSHLVLGDPEEFRRSDTGEKFRYSVEVSAVIGSRVWVACRFVCSLGFNNRLLKDDVD